MQDINKILMTTTKFEFGIGGFWGGYEQVSLQRQNNIIVIDHSLEGPIIIPPNEVLRSTMSIVAFEQLLQQLGQIIKDWLPRYPQSKKYDVMDGVQWSLTLTDSKPVEDARRHSWECFGNNEYPENFSELMQLLHDNQLIISPND